MLQQVGFGSPLNLALGMSVANLVSMTPASSASLSLQRADTQKVRQALEDLAVEFREVLREWRGLILQTDRRCGRYSYGRVMSRLARAGKCLQESLANRRE